MNASEKDIFEGAAERSSAASFWEGGNVNGRRRNSGNPGNERTLREQGSIRALLELLEQQGMEQEKGDVLRMADYIDSMEMQLGTVLKELGEVKKQLGVMQESKVKLFAVNTIQKTEHQVQTLRFQVGEWKRKFVGRAEQAVMDFKEKGKDALACAVKGMHLTQGLQKSNRLCIR